MKRIIFVIGLLLVVSSFIIGQQKDPKLEATLIQMDKDWTAAELKGDTKAAGMFVADDFWETTQEGKVWNKAQYLADVKATKDTDVADDYSVRFFGDTAIMTHRGTVKGERDFQYRSTHVWMNRGGKWQIVAHHSSEIPASTPAPAKKVMTPSSSMSDAAPASGPIIAKPAKP